MLWFTAALVAGVAVAREVPAAVHLDSYTLPKLHAFHDLLVCFDKYIPYGGKHDRFKDIALQVGNLQPANFLVAWVGVQDYGDFLNKDLHDKYNVKETDFPAYKMFLRGSPTPIDYTGPKTSRKQILQFIQNHTGVYTGGKPGCLKDFDDLASRFMAPGADQAVLKQEANEAAATLTDESQAASARVYLKAMDKIIDQGPAYPKTEMARIEKLMSGNLSEKKKEEFSKRINVLESFSAKKK